MEHKLQFTTQQISHYLNDLFNMHNGLKTIGIAMLWIAGQLFDPVLYKEVIISICILPAIDYLTGIIAAKKNGEATSSKGFYRSVVKVVTYGLVLAASRLVEAPVPELGILDNLAIKMITVTEIWSIIENFDKLGYVKSKQLKDIIRGVKK